MNLECDLLTAEQIYGEEALEIFEKYGTKSKVTDFAVYCGGNEFYEKGVDPTERTGSYWTKTPYRGKVVTISSKDTMETKRCAAETLGCRPVVSYEAIKDFAPTTLNKETGVKEIEFGEFPQTIVDAELAYELEKLHTMYWRNQDPKEPMSQTGKRYTYHKYYSSSDTIEFEYKGKRYIRVSKSSDKKDAVLSNGTTVDFQDNFWIAVEPIKWLVDEKSGLAVSENILYAGVPMTNKLRYNGTFKGSQMDIYLNDCFAKEIITREILEKTKPDQLNQVLETIALQEARLKQELEKLNAIEGKNMDLMAEREKTLQMIEELEKLKNQISVELIKNNITNGPELITDNSLEQSKKAV